MSVLLDALKKSEEEKRKSEGEAAPEGGEQPEASAAPPPSDPGPEPGPDPEPAPKTPAPKPAPKPGLGKLGMFSTPKEAPKPGGRPGGPGTAGPRPAPPPGMAAPGMAPPKPPAAGGGAPAPSFQLGAKPAAAPSPAPAAAKAPEASFDFDSIEEPAPAGSALQMGRSAPAAGQAQAGSIVDAGESAVDVGRHDQEIAPKRGAKAGLVLALAAGVAVVGVGAYFLLAPTGPTLPTPGGTAIPGAAQDVAAEEQDPVGLLPLPTPRIDIQKELVNFASFSDSGTGGLSAQQEDVASRIALLTSNLFGTEGELGLDGALEEESGDAVAGIDLGDLEVEQVEETEPEIPVEEYPLVTSSASEASLARDLSTVDLGDGVRVYEVAASAMPAAQAADGGMAPAAPEPVATEVASEMVIDRSAKADVIGRMLDSAKRDYDEGDLSAAEVTFRKVLADDPNNTNAMKGLAMVASETGRYRLAASIYLKVLELSPSDPVVIAELISMQARQSNPVLTEQRIKSLLGRAPGHDGRLFFALGNLYAEQGRWIEAQQSYFNALSEEPDNPDYAFNLAVSLEFLNRQGIALTYYRRAQELAKDAPHGFDAATLQTRILQLDS